jgi:PKD repeat protein
VVFQNISISGNNISIHWKFGDGSNSTLSDPTHTYTTSGSYEVCLVIIDNSCELSDTICQTILITGIEEINSYWNHIITVAPNPATDGIEISNIPSMHEINRFNFSCEQHGRTD